MKLHIGCGDKYIPGFIHVDIRPLPHVDLVTPADKLSMVLDNSVELIYACHILEHFSRYYTIFVLNEWFRVLKPSGVLRLSVPDFDAINLRYTNSANLYELMGLLYGKQDYKENTHLTCFNFRTLSNVLKDAGFKQVNRYDWRNTEHAGIDDFSQAYLPHMDKEHGLLMSLNVEAIK